MRQVIATMRLTATGFLAAIVACTAAAQGPPSRLRAIDIYRSTQFDTAAFERRHESTIRELVEAMAAGDEPAIQRLEDEIRAAVEASGEFAHMAFSLTTSPEPDVNLIDVSIELVDPADAGTRLDFADSPVGAIADPDGVLADWAEFERQVLSLVQSRAIEPRVDDCPAWHCIVGFEHEQLAPYLERFDRAARDRHDELLRVLREDADAGKRAAAAFVLAHGEDGQRLVRDLVPSLDDPAAGVRNNVMRVLGFVARADASIPIPLAPLAARIDDPDGGCRNKAAWLIAALAKRPEHRADILALASGIMRLLRLDKPNVHEPAYGILKTISGEDFGARDYASWEAWIAAQRRPSARVQPAR